MTQQQAINYCLTNWGWTKRDATLAKNRWDLMGEELISRIEEEMISQEDLICLTMARIAASRKLEVKRTWKPGATTKALMYAAAAIMGVVFPLIPLAFGYSFSL